MDARVEDCWEQDGTDSSGGSASGGWQTKPHRAHTQALVNNTVAVTPPQHQLRPRTKLHVVAGDDVCLVAAVILEGAVRDLDATEHKRDVQRGGAGRQGVCLGFQRVVPHGRRIGDGRVCLVERGALHFASLIGGHRDTQRQADLRRCDGRDDGLHAVWRCPTPSTATAR